MAGSGMVSFGMVMVGWVTLAAVLLYVVVIARAGQMRERHKIAAPEMAGHPDFERAVRVQVNTLENLVPFLVCLWLSALYWWPMGAAIIGIVWLVGRALYAVAYYREPKGRHVGFGLAALANILLLLGAAYGLIRIMLILPA